MKTPCGRFVFWGCNSMASRRYLKTIVQFKRNSVFIGTFIILLALIVLILSTFYQFASSLYAQNMKDKTYQAAANVLEHTSNTVDSLLGQVLVSTTSFMKNQDVVEATVAPNELNYSRNKTIMEQITAILRSDPLIENFYYYIPSNETVFATESGVTNYLEYHRFEQRDAIEHYLSRRQADGDLLLAREIRAQIYSMGHRLYLYYPFPVKNLLGLAVIELNPAVLYQYTHTAGQEQGSTLCIYDRNWNPLFSGMQAYPAIPLSGRVSDAAQWEGESQLFYRHTSASIGWNYVYAVDLESIQLRENISLGALAPYLLFFFAAGLLCALVITRRIYKPIHELLLDVSGGLEGIDKAEHPEARNEFEYFRLAYHDMVNKAKWFMELTSNMTPAILEGLFKAILSGNCPDEAYSYRMLEQVGMPFEPESPYAALVGEVLDVDGVRAQDGERRQYLTGIEAMIGELLPAPHKRFSYLDEKGRLIWILNFTGGKGTAAVDEQLSQLCGELNRRACRFPGTVLVAHGPACPTIQTLNLSYREATAALAEIRRFAERGEAPEPVEQRQGGSAAALQQRIPYLIQLALKGGREKAEDFAVQTIRELLHACGDSVRPSEAATQFARQLSQQLEGLADGDPALRQLETRLAESLEEGAEDRERLERHLTVFCMRALELAETANSRNSLRHIQSVRDYVMEHYGDSTLSLHSVSDYIGISPSYLSRLVNAHMQQGFNSYVNWVRTEKAKRLLAETALSSVVVSQRTGFNSVQSFNRVFKKHAGVTPGQFRTDRREAETIA